MKRRDIIDLNKEYLEKLYFFGVKTEHYIYSKIFKEYEKMKSDGDKVTFIVAHLSEKYGYCESKIYKIIRWMQEDCSTED